MKHRDTGASFSCSETDSLNVPILLLGIAVPTTGFLFVISEIFLAARLTESELRWA
jgi:hypothetical protein